MGFTEIGVLLVRWPYLVGDGSLLRRRMMGAAGRVSFALFSLGIQEVGLVREFSFSSCGNDFSECYAVVGVERSSSLYVMAGYTNRGWTKVHGLQAMLRRGPV